MCLSAALAVNSLIVMSIISTAFVATLSLSSLVPSADAQACVHCLSDLPLHLVPVTEQSCHQTLSFSDVIP